MNKEQELDEQTLYDYRKECKLIFQYDEQLDKESFKKVKLEFNNIGRSWNQIKEVEKELKRYVRNADELLVYTYSIHHDCVKNFVDVNINYKIIKIEGYDEWLEFFDYCRNGGEFKDVSTYRMYLKSEDSDIPYSLWCEIYRDEINKKENNNE